MPIPIDFKHERHFPEHWQGTMIICDIDSIYFNTRFSFLSGLMRNPFEFAVDKQDLPGIVALLREIRSGPDQRSRNTPLYFLSASPAQLRRVIQKKMLLDGLEFDGTIFKDWLTLIRQLNVKRFKDQLGYKLTALLMHRQKMPIAARNMLIGDDLELDPLSFCLYADVLAGRLNERQLLRALSRQGVHKQDAKSIIRLTYWLPRNDVVERILIRLERFRDPLTFVDFYPGLIPCQSALQMALNLYETGQISLEGVGRVIEALRLRHISREHISQEIIDAVERGIVTNDNLSQLQSVVGNNVYWNQMFSCTCKEPWLHLKNQSAEKPWTPSRFWAH